MCKLVTFVYNVEPPTTNNILPSSVCASEY